MIGAGTTDKAMAFYRIFDKILSSYIMRAQGTGFVNRCRIFIFNPHLSVYSPEEKYSIDADDEMCMENMGVNDCATYLRSLENRIPVI